MAQNRTILLIGASGGVGQAIAPDLAKAGYNLALHYFDNADALEALKPSLDEAGVKVAFYQADITQESDVADMVQNVLNDFGAIEVLVNNAGISLNGMSWKMPLENWQKSLDVNLTGPFLCMKHVLPSMRQNGFGRVVSVTSIVGQTGVPGTAGYAASKAGLIGLTKTVAKEVATKGVTVNCISLGYFKAGMLYELPEEMREAIRETIPQKEFGNTAAISKSILYLCSEQADYVTGQTLNLNGGLY